MRVLSRWVSRWLERRGLSLVADAMDRRSAQDGDPAALHAMGKRAMERGDNQKARDLLRQAVAVQPQAAELWCSLGAACRHAGSFEEARTAYERALAIEPAYPQVLSNMGEWHIANGQPEQALPWLEWALGVAPDFFQARINRTAALFELGRFEQARLIAEQLAKDEPQSAQACLNLGNVLVHTGKTKQGIRQYQRALELQRNYAEAHFNLSSLLGSKEDLALAIGYLERRLEERGDSVQNLGMLASAYQAAGRLQESEQLCRRILQRQPGNMTALITLGSCLSNSGDSAAAVALYQQVVDNDPTQVAMGSNILFEYNYVDTMQREQLYALHRDWAQRFEQPLLARSDFPSRNRDPQRRLRIGYVSGDFTRHPVGFLLRDVLLNHDKQQFSVHCFSMVIRPQDVLPELRQAADHWHDVFFLTDEEVVALVQEQEIDILIDLSGHTAFHRLQAFARRPAPVQVEWIGYFHSTGMECMDYFITDPFTSPRGSGQLFSEVPVHLPHTRFCYGPPEYAPEVAALPALSRAHVTFGSFNRLPKLTDATVQTWARILRAVPESQLVIKSGALSDAVACERVRQRFAQWGIGAERLQLREGSNHPDMLAEYGDIDIALDTFPFNGGMTTLEALWMGVPVVTLAGDTVVSRQTVSALANIGLQAQLAFASVDDYVQGAVALAHDRQQLADLRQSLRPRVASSPLRDARQFSRDLEHLLRRMWQACCKGEKLPSDV